MILYGILIFLSVALIAVFNAVFAVPVYPFGVTYAILAPVIATAAVIALDGFLAFLIRRLPEKPFSRKKIFSASKSEKAFYERLKIRKWKDKIPELGGFTHFSKSTIEKPFDNEYLSRYMLEAAYGEVIHFVTAFTGFSVTFIFPLDYWYCFGFPVAVVNMILNFMPLFVLRYNYYKLNILYKNNERKSSAE